MIDIEEAIYKECIPYKDTPIISNLANYNSEIIYAIANGTPLPDGAEILTKEAYSDLCTRADDVPDFESEEYVNERLENYSKMLKSGIIISRNLCESCINNGCIFQSGIVRHHCDFYKAESEDKLDGNPVDIDNAVEHYERTLEVLKGIDLEDKA